jgi:hypothetical protein
MYKNVTQPLPFFTCVWPNFYSERKCVQQFRSFPHSTFIKKPNVIKFVQNAIKRLKIILTQIDQRNSLHIGNQFNFFKSDFFLLILYTYFFRLRDQDDLRKIFKFYILRLCGALCNKRFSLALQILQNKSSCIFTDRLYIRYHKCRFLTVI